MYKYTHGPITVAYDREHPTYYKRYENRAKKLEYVLALLLYSTRIRGPGWLVWAFSKPLTPNC